MRKIFINCFANVWNIAGFAELNLLVRTVFGPWIPELRVKPGFLIDKIDFYVVQIQNWFLI